MRCKVARKQRPYHELEILNTLGDFEQRETFQQRTQCSDVTTAVLLYSWF